MHKQWEAAVKDWRSTLGVDYIVTDSAALAAAEKTTFSIARRIPAILRPSSRSEVQECLRIARRHSVALYPISGGKNWGYGSRVPAETNSALLDLGRMNKILEYNEDLGYVTIEPGVTQEQLYEFLAARRMRLWMDATGSSSKASVIGNTVERGFGHTPYGDHFAFGSGMEVVLPDGECIETGFGRFPGAITAPLYRWGVGPSLDGLFSQSNLGIVTRMSVGLMPAPEYFQAFFFRCGRRDQAGSVVETLSRLRLTGTIQSTVHVGNDYKVLAGLRQYPWKELKGETPLPQPRISAFRHKLGFGAWSGSGGLYGSRNQVAESRRQIKAALAGKVDRLAFIDDARLAMMRAYSAPVRLLTRWDLSKTLSFLEPLYGLLKGVPSDHSLRSAYWRKKSAIPQDMDPDRDGCGLIWFAPIIPARKADVEAMERVTTETLLAAGFEPMISLSLINGRAVACVISICYDRDVAGEDDKAMRCYRQLAQNVHSLGYYSYRLGIQSMEEMGESASYANVLRKLKSALDPEGILAPGRYEAGEMSISSARRKKS